jgi:hypothetical protein
VIRDPAVGEQFISFNLTPGLQTAATLYQDVATITGARYHLRFAYAGDPVVAGQSGCSASENLKRLGVRFGSGPMETVSFDVAGHGERSMGWTYADRLVTATGATTRLQFKSLHEGNCGPTLDDVSLVTPAPNETATTLTASTDHLVWGQPVTLSSTVISAQPATTPPGSMQFKLDGLPLGAPVTLDGGGKATATAPTLEPGSHTVTAEYQPAMGTMWDRSQSSPVALTVEKARTATTVADAPATSVFGQSVTATVTVGVMAPGSGVPAGTVQLMLGDGTPIGPPQLLAGMGQTSFLVPSPPVGRHTVRALYSGDSHFEASSATGEHSVERARTATSIVSDANPVTAGSEVTFTIDVTTVAPGHAVPGGAVRILVGGVDVSGPIPLFADGADGAAVAVTFRAPTSPGSDVVGAAYSGDANTEPSSAPPFVQTIAAPVFAPAIAPPVPSPQPASAPTASRAPMTSKSLRTMTKPLLQALKRRGAAALDGFTERLTVSAPGRLTQLVYSPKAPALASRLAKPVLIASGSRQISRAGSASMRLRVTAAGRKALQRARSIKLEIVTRFAPADGTSPLTVRSGLKVNGRRAG